MKRILICAACLLLLSSHDLFLKTNHYFLKPQQNDELFLFNGTFDESDNVIDRDRIIQPVIMGPDYRFVPQNADWYDEADATFLKFKTGKAGTYVAGVSTKARNIELSAEDFNGYLEHDGILDVLAERKASGELNKAATERYAKHVKLLLQVGETYSQDYQKVLGYPAEFVPLTNPYEAKVGDTVSFRLLRNGSPLANQLVYAAYRAPNEQSSGQALRKEISARTDAEGKFSIKLNSKGRWYLRTIHMVKCAEPDIDYESNWATLGFAVK